MEKNVTLSEQKKLEMQNYIATTCSPEQIEELYKAFLECKNKTT